MRIRVAGVTSAAVIAGVLTMTCPHLTRAAEPDDYGESSPSGSHTKQDRAVEAYNDGYRLVQKGEDFAAQSFSIDDKAWKESQKAFKSSLKKFEDALKLNPAMHEAYTYIGYANRQLGNYDACLTAYEQALRLKPQDPQAIEYQGEAFLGLKRVDDAKSNYEHLYALDQPQAHKLLRAIKRWADANAAQPPAGVDIGALKAWAAERELLHDPNEKTVR